MKINKAHIVIHPDINEKHDTVKALVAAFRCCWDCHIEMQVIKKMPEGCNSRPLGRLEGAPDIVAAVGGDGTFLTAARLAVGHNVPVLGISSGRKGFLTEIPSEKIDDIVQAMADDQHIIVERMMLDMCYESEKGTALNEVSLVRAGQGLAMIRVLVNKEPLDTMIGDGVIISTPTGSTAYSLSAGGPIVHPAIKSVLITPLAPHSLHSRPVMLSDQDTLELEILDNSSDMYVSIDGHNICETRRNTALNLQASQYVTKTIAFKDWNFFSVLRSKLGWGDSGDVRKM